MKRLLTSKLTNSIGQHAVEYLLLLAVVLVVLVVFLTPNGAFHSELDKSLQTVVEKFDIMASKYACKDGNEESGCYVCGDGICNKNAGESMASCSEDCSL